jgi:hypothetical protein
MQFVCNATAYGDPCSGMGYHHTAPSSLQYIHLYPFPETQAEQATN